jgi:hypothetical protein
MPSMNRMLAFRPRKKPWLPEATASLQLSQVNPDGAKVIQTAAARPARESNRNPARAATAGTDRRRSFTREIVAAAPPDHQGPAGGGLRWYSTTYTTTPVTETYSQIGNVQWARRLWASQRSRCAR